MRSPRPIPIVLIATLALWLLVVRASVASSPCPNADLDPSRSNLEGMRGAVLCLLNAQRAAAGLRGLSDNALLDQAASSYSREMVREGFFSHTSPQGITLGERLIRVGFLRGVGTFRFGEDLATGLGPVGAPSAIVQAWMRSAEHRANILNGAFDEIGIGIAAGSPNGGGTPAATYAVDFGAVPARLARQARARHARVRRPHKLVHS
jgi:uncharacterized protein YkwD